MSNPFHEQPHHVVDEEGRMCGHELHGEPAHMVRSVGNCVGLPASRNTNRPNPEYARRHDRIARKNGFMNAAHRAIFNAMMTAKIEAAKEQK